MSDLSRLLGGVYDSEGDQTVTDVESDSPGEAAPTVWHADDQLDAAFEGWVPGPSGDASGRERGMFAEAQSRPAASPPPAPQPDSTASTSPTDAAERAPGANHMASEAWPIEVPGRPEAELGTTDDLTGQMDATEAVPAIGWRPEDDDILPTRTVRRFLSLRR